jgi:hypothetical protein
LCPAAVEYVPAVRWRLLLLAVAALAAAPLAWAQVEERLSVGTYLQGVNQAGGRYSRALFVVLASPPEYERETVGRFGNGGVWRGPPYAATLRPSLGGNSSMDWGIGFEFDTADPREAIRQNLVHDWPEIEGGQVLVQHRIGATAAGTIPAVWSLTRSTFYGEVDAAYEVGVAVPICGGFAMIHFSTLQPSGDSAGGSMGFGDYLVKGSVKPTVWNRQQLRLAIDGVRIEGPLPATRVTAAARGRRVSGRVSDCYGHPVSGTRVTLERRVGRRWTRAGTASTGATGAYAAAVRAAGLYRAAAGARRSPAVRVR